MNLGNVAKSERGWEVVRKCTHRRRSRVNDESAGYSDSAIADKAGDLTNVVA